MTGGKTDKQLVWEALKRIEDWTAEINRQQFLIMPEDIWENYPKEVQLRLRALMLNDGLIQIIGNNQWAFQLTPSGMMLKLKELKRDGSLKNKKSYKQFWLGVLATGLGAVLSTVLSAGLEVWKAQRPQNNLSKTIVLPKIQLVHDTVYLKKK